MNDDEEHMWKVMEFFVGPGITEAVRTAQKILEANPEYRAELEKTRKRIIEDASKILLGVNKE